MHPRRGCWLANTHYLEGLDTVRIYCCELLNGRWQKRVGTGSGFRRSKTTAFVTFLVAKAPATSAACRGQCAALRAWEGQAGFEAPRAGCGGCIWT
jgi:hypothetical protein